MSRYALLLLTIVLLLASDALDQATCLKGAGESTGLHEAKLRQAFPDDTWAWKAAIKCYIHSTGVVFASDAVSHEPDGRIKLTPCAIAWLGKDKEKTHGKLCTAVKCEFALLQFDGPISHFDDIGKQKIVSVELPDGMQLNMKK